MSRGPRHAVVEAKLPVVQVEIRPGRTIAVHHHCPSSQAAPRARLFFVHGSCGSMLQYEALIAHFAPAGHEIVAFDYVGCGRSPKPKSWYAYSFDELQADAAAVVATYGRSSSSATTKNVLVCHSAGCLFGLGLAAAAGTGAQSAVAAEVHGLILMAPGYVPDYKPLPLFYLPARVLSWIQPKLDAGFEALALHETTTDPALATETRKAVLALAREVNASNPAYMFKAYYRQLVMPTAEEVTRAGLSVPSIALIVGDSDKLVPRTRVNALQALLPPGVHTHEVSEASHQMMQEEPEACIALVERFLVGCA